jgi:hypothetical protein
MKKIAFFCLLFFVALISVNAAQSRETLTLVAAGCQSLNIDCGAGSLKVQGEDKLEQIEVSAVLVVNGISESELPGFKKEYVTLKLKKSGNKAVLTAEIESGSSFATLFGIGRNARIDLDVRLPRRLALDVDDGSGDCEIRDCDGGLKLEDGSGDARLANLKARWKSKTVQATSAWPIWAAMSRSRTVRGTSCCAAAAATSASMTVPDRPNCTISVVRW